MNAVSANENIGFHFLAIVKSNLYGFIPLRKARAASTQMNGCRIECGAQERMKLGPVNCNETGSPAGFHDLLGLTKEPPPIRPPDARPDGASGQGEQFISKSEGPNGPNRIGPQTQSGSYLTKLGCLLVHLDAHVGSRESKSGRDPSDSTTDNDDLDISHSRQSDSFHNGDQGVRSTRSVTVTAGGQARDFPESGEWQRARPIRGRKGRRS
jgi:hypothetical protein